MDFRRVRLNSAPIIGNFHASAEPVPALYAKYMILVENMAGL